jgi:hypothetical protein
MSLRFKKSLGFLLVFFAVNLSGKDLKFDESIAIENGTSVSYRNHAVFAPMAFSLYAIGFYVNGDETDNMKLKNADKPMAIQLVSLYRWLKMEKLMSELRRGFSYGMDHDKKFLKTIQNKIDTFIELLIGEGDRYLGKYKRVTFIYQPGKGTHISYEGKILGVIPGHDFKKALFGIWLNNNCANDELRKKIVKMKKKK